MGQEDGEIEYGSLEELTHLDSPISPSSEPPQVEISLNSVMRLSSAKTLKMTSTINGQAVIVMVDPGATHNFISTEMVQRLQLLVTHSKAFGVSLGTGT